MAHLGVVERREVPPASLFRLVPEHIASCALLALARCSDLVLDETRKDEAGIGSAGAVLCTKAEEFAEAAAGDLTPR